MPGRIVFASEGPRTFVGINTESAQYPGERFIFDGKSASVALSSLNKRSFLGNFVQDNAVMQKSGLIGGELSTGWLMANYSPDKGKLSYEGNGKVNGKSSHVLQFTPKGGSDISIKLFFDAETYRHLRTEYRRMVSAPQGVMQQNGIGRSDINSGRQSETRIDLTEEFADFKTENGLTLPRGYKLIYSYSGNQGTVSAEWNFVLTEFVTNQKIRTRNIRPG